MIIFGSRGVTKKEGGGRFFCPQCYQQQRYQLHVVRSYFTLYYIPLIPLEVVDQSVACLACGSVFSGSILTYNPAQADQEFYDEVKRVMVLVAMADGRIMPEEIATIQRLYQQLAGRKLSRQDIEAEVQAAGEIGHDAASYARSIGRSLGGEGLRIVAQHAFLVAAAAGKLSPARNAQLKQFPDALGISEDEFRALIEEINDQQTTDHGRRRQS